MHKGWLYLVAFLDWFSRYVVSWEYNGLRNSDSELSDTGDRIQLY
jgi:hypothetical protein